MKHVLCTGQPGCGKTTLVRRCIEEIVGRGIHVTGFVTDEVVRNGSRIGFDVVSLNENGTDDLRGVLSRKRRYNTDSDVVWKKTGNYHVNVTEFERIALSAMRCAKKKKKNCVLIVGTYRYCSTSSSPNSFFFFKTITAKFFLSNADEIGRMELHSNKFRDLMKELLNTSGVRVVGALTAPIYGHRVPFCDEISDRDDVDVVKITVKTRIEAERLMMRKVLNNGHDDETKKYVCYTIMSATRTYVGITNNLKRRLRQHNGEIKGGAKYTRGYSNWKLVYFLSGFRTKVEALQFEWSLRHVTGRGRASGSGLSGRLKNLERVLSMSRWTSKSPLASDVPLSLNWVLSKLRPIRFESVLPNHVREECVAAVVDDY
jgi:nucleoside-triphosphatase THEP1/predicted GIY-YIG superfamily endonuclease